MEVLTETEKDLVLEEFGLIFITHWADETREGRICSLVSF